MAEEEKEVTWSDIEKIMEETEREREKSKKWFEEKLKRDAERKKKVKPSIQKSKGYLESLKGIKPYKLPSSVDEFSEKTEEQVDRYIRSVERKTQKKLDKLRRQERKYLKKGGGLLGTPRDDYYRVKQRREILEDLVKALKRTWGGLEEELQLKKLEPDYKPPGLLSRMWNYVTGGSKKVKNAYPALLVLLLLVFLISRKGSMTGYIVLETVTNNSYLSYFLVFILVICLIAFYKLDKK